MKNLVESAVLALYDDLRKTDDAFCGCELCREDVLAYVLNQIRPRYSGGSDEGWALTSVDLQRDQMRAELTVVVLEALRRVAASPRHRRRSGGVPQVDS